MKNLTCPYCGYKTMESDGHYHICSICFWSDDPFQKMNVHDLGANKVSLVKAQQNYMQYGACTQHVISYVRKPTIKDSRNPNWKPIKDELYELKLACRKFYDGAYTIAQLQHHLSWIDLPDDISKLVKQVENDLEIIRFCSRDYKQRDETLLVVKA